MSDSVYDATGSKPTNYEAFEDSVEDKTVDATESLKQALTNEAYVAALASAVGSIIWQSWQSKDSASKETNMFAALSAIIEESKATTSSESSATLTLPTKSIVAKVEADSDNTIAYQDLMLDAVANIVELLKHNDASSTASSIASATTSQSSALDEFASTKTPDIVKYGASAIAFKEVIEQLSKLTGSQSRNVYRALSMFDDIVKALDKAAPLFDKVLTTIVDSVLANAAKLTQHKDKLDNFVVLADTFNSFADSLLTSSQALLLGAAAIASLGLAIAVFGTVVSLDTLGMFALGSATMLTFFWALTKLDTDAMQKASSSMLALSGSIALFTLAVVVGGQVLAENIGSTAMVLSTMVAFAGAMRLINLIAGPSGTLGASVSPGASQGMLVITASIALLGLSIWAWHEVVPSYEYAVAPMAAGLAMAGMLWLIGKGAQANAKDAGIGMLAVATSIGVLALALHLWNYVDTDSAGKALAGLGTMTVVVGLLTLIKGDASDAGKGLLWAAAAVGALAIALLPWKLIDEESMVKAGIGFGVLATVLGLMSRFGGNPAQMTAAGMALLVGAATVAVLGFALLVYNNIDAATVGVALLAMGGMAGIVALLGTVGPAALMGAGALAAVAAASWVFGKSAQMIGAVPDGTIPAVLGYMTGAATLATVTGNPFTIAFTLTGAAALAAVGGSMYLFAKTIKAIADTKLTQPEIDSIGQSLTSFINIVVDSMSANRDKLDDAKKGIDALKGLGNMLSTLASGIASMAVLSFPKYEARNGELVIVGTIDIEDALPRIGTSIGMLIDSLIEPLAKVGADAGFLKNSAVEKGIDALKGLGNLFSNFAQGLASIATLVFPRYEARDGKLVVVGTIDMKEQLPKIGSSIGAMIEELVKPLREIGKEDNKWFLKSDIEKGIKQLSNIGNVFNPMVAMIDAFNKHGIDKAYVDDKFKPTLTSMVASLGSFVTGIANFDTRSIYAKSNAVKSLFKSFDADNLESSVKLLERTDKGLTAIRETLQTLNVEKLTKLDLQIKSFQSKSIVDGINALANVIKQNLTPAMQELFDKLKSVLEALDEREPSSGMPSSFAMQPAFASANNSNFAGGMRLINDRPNVLGADKFEDWRNDSDNPIMAILVEILDMLDGQGIKVHG